MSEKLFRSPSVGTITKPTIGDNQQVAENVLPSAPANLGNLTSKALKSEPAPPRIEKTAPAYSPTENMQQENIRPQKSQSSLRSDEDNITRGREINDTLMGRILYLRHSFFAIISSAILLFVLCELKQEKGITVPIGGKIFHQTIPIIFEVWFYACFLFTDAAMSQSLAAFFGFKLSEKHGFSLIVCGFVQCSYIAKIQFSGLLNFRSKFKKVISRASMTWALHLAMLLLTFFSATAIEVSTTRYDDGTLLCVEFGQEGQPSDRGWPTMETESGVAEFIFGSSLGKLSSEDPTASNTTLITYPQLIDACLDGTFIVGNGLTTNFQTTCDCSSSNSVADAVDAGVPADIAVEMLKMFADMNEGQGWVNYISKSEDYADITITTMMSGNHLCGGANYENWSIPICTTNFGSHNFAQVEISWMNDGQKSRNAPNIVNLLNETGPANRTWLYQALINGFEGELTANALPGFYPGTVNPLFWWMTPNLQALSLSSFLYGIETSFAMMLKVGITRTYSVQGASCVQNLEDSFKTTLNITETGFTLGMAFVIFELFLAFVSILGCVPWFLHKDPVLPAIRLVSDQTYFNVMLCKNSTGNLLRIIGATADKTDIWPKLDIEVRVGENIQTVSDPDSGEIIVDRPKLVTSLSWSKCY